MNTENMETSITSEMISQQTVSGEIERPNKDHKFPEITKKFHGHTIRMKNKLVRELMKLSKLEKI